jgi:acyl dehydratase
VTWEEIAVGASPPPRTLGPITVTDSVRYQGASGDMNPVHHDEAFARAAGYPAPLTVGMFPAGVLGSWVAGWLGPEKIRRLRLRWRAPVFPGDVLTLEARVSRKGDDDLEVELAATKSGGEVAVLGWATFVR